MHERILRLNIAGSPVEWLSWEDAATLQARGMVAWTLGSPCMTVRGGRSRLQVNNRPLCCTQSWLAKDEFSISQAAFQI